MSKKVKFVVVGCGCVLVLVLMLTDWSDDSEGSKPNHIAFDGEQQSNKTASSSGPLSILAEQEQVIFDDATQANASIGAAADSTAQQGKTQEEIDREEMDPASESNHQLRLEQGFSAEASRALAGNSGKSTVSISDMPPEIQDDLRAASRDIAELGYEEVEYEFLKSIADVILYLIDDAELERVVAFKMTKPDEKFTEGYELLGASYPGVGERIIGDKSVETISRTYTSLDSTNALHLVETSLINGSSVILTEFENTAVRDYPAYFRIYRNSQSGEEISGITWVDENFDTTLYYIGVDPAAVKEYLLEKATILQNSRSN